MKHFRHYNKDMAIVLSCFGSVVEEKKYLNLKTHIENSFPGTPVFIAFSSRTVLKKLKENGTTYNNLQQTLANLDLDGYRNIVVSSVYLYPTEEHERTKKISNAFSSISMSNIRVTDALLNKINTTNNIIKHLHELHQKDDTARVFISHGAPYLDIAGVNSIFYVDNLLKQLDSNNYSCSLEGATPFNLVKESIIKSIKESNIQNIEIVPLLLSSGNHFDNDVHEIKEELEKQFKVSIARPVNDDKFNLLSLDIVKESFTTQIKNEITKLGI